MELQGQPIPTTGKGTKVTTDPRSAHRIGESSGPVANDSLAAESIRAGGTYSKNRSAAPLGVSGGHSTLNNTDTSGAITLPPASDKASREDRQEQLKYPEALGGQGEFPGAHLPETGYVGGPTIARREMTTRSHEYPASQKLEEKPDSYRSPYNAGQAPGYVRQMMQNLGDEKPKGDVKKDGFDPNADNASFSSEIGSSEDPGRRAQNAYQRSMAESGPYATEAGREENVDNKHWYQQLQHDEPL